jgi:cytochrome c peroxidase
MALSSRWLLLPVGLLALAGCSGDGGNSSPAPAPAVPAVSTAPAAPPEVQASAPAQEKTTAADVPVKRVTPTSGINPKAQVDVVREEVKGGEFSAGPSPFDYLWQPPQTAVETDEPMEVEVPAGLPPLTPGVYVPVSNPLTRAKWELGRQLYFEPRISKDGTVSCATCHNPEKGWTDQLPTSVGIYGQSGSRNAPTVLNTVYGKSMFWDGRAPSLEGQAQGPIQNPIEMGEQSYKEIVERLRQIPGYQEQFRKVFGTEVTLDGLAKAIATFERTALSGNSKYDRYQSGQFEALNESEKRGMVLFGLRLHPDDEFQAEGVTLQKARCTLCHVGFNFTDEQFHNIGVGYDAETRSFKDLGRWAVTPIGAKYDGDRGAFKTPTCRDLTRTAPYMHDGSEPTLTDVVKYYNRGGNVNDALDKDIKPLNLTDQEIADLVAFLEALTGEERKVELPALPPGPDGTAPDPRDALKPPPPKTAAAEFLHGLVR